MRHIEERVLGKGCMISCVLTVNIVGILQKYFSLRISQTMTPILQEYTKKSPFNVSRLTSWVPEFKIRENKYHEGK